MLIYLEDWEDQADNVVNEMIEQVLIAFVHLDHSLVRRRDWAVVEVEEVEIHRLFRKRLVGLLEVRRLLQPAIVGERTRSRRRLKCAECRNGRVPARRHIIDEHLGLGLDVDFVWWERAVGMEWRIHRRHADRVEHALGAT